jgi:hypothetical protein
MTYYLIVGGKQQRPLATTTGWYDFKRWARGLNVEHYPQLTHIVDWAWAQNLDDLLRELKLALVAAPPESETVEETLRSLMDSVAFSKGSSSIFVTDGLGEEFGDDDEELPDE